MHSLVFPFIVLLSAIFSNEKWSFFLYIPDQVGDDARKQVGDDDGEDGGGMTK